MADEFIDNVTYTQGSQCGGSIANTWVDDANGLRICSTTSGYWRYINVTLNFNPVVGGRDFYISADMRTTFGVPNQTFLKINGVTWKTGSTINFDDELKNGVNSISYQTAYVAYFDAYIYWLKLVEVSTGYAHKFCGVLPANIGKISGVATANIGKVKGV